MDHADGDSLDLVSILIVAGYHMAKNLRAKIPAEDILMVRDVNPDTAQRFAEEARQEAKKNGAKDDTWKVEVAESARDVAENSVSFGFLVRLFWLCRDPSVFVVPSALTNHRRPWSSPVCLNPSMSRTFSILS